MDAGSAVVFFYDTVFADVNDHIPMIELRQKYPLWFNRNVRELLREKEQAHKCKKANLCDANTEKHARARAEFKLQANASYCDYLMGLVQDFKDNPKRYWTFIKSLKSNGLYLPS